MRDTRGQIQQKKCTRHGQQKIQNTAEKNIKEYWNKCVEISCNESEDWILLCLQFSPNSFISPERFHRK